MQWCYSVVKIQAFRLDPFIITSRDFILAGNNTSIGNFLAITKTNSYTERMIFRSSILIFAQFHSVNNTWSLLTNCVYILSYCTNITRTGIIQINCFFLMVSGNVHCNSVDLLDCMYVNTCKHVLCNKTVFRNLWDATSLLLGIHSQKLIEPLWSL